MQQGSLFLLPTYCHCIPQEEQIQPNQLEQVLAAFQQW